MSDVGRRFHATRVLEMDIQLSAQDVEDQVLAGDTAEQSAALIAGSAPDNEWTIVNQEVREL